MTTAPAARRLTPRARAMRAAIERIENDTKFVVMVLADIEDRACTEDYCFVCHRATDHGGEHTEEQLLRWANTN